MEQNRKRKKIKRILSFLAVFCCLAGSVMGAAAMVIQHNQTAMNAAVNSAINWDGEIAVPEVTFVNETDHRPNLSIKKVVQDQEGHLYTDAADPEFTFILSLGVQSADGTEKVQPVNKMEFKLYDAAGREVDKRDSLGFRVPHKTDAFGMFKLKAGEKAVFEYVGGCSYKIEETDLPEHYEYKNGVSQVTGTIGQTGGRDEEFVNVYTGGNTGTATTLRVSKLTPFQQTLDHFEMPDMPDFTFRIRLADETGQLKPYNLESYSIVYTTTDGRELTKGTGTTDGNGEFLLPAGCTAVFENITAGVDYEVREVTGRMPEGWWSVGDTVFSGVTEELGTARTFINSNLSFIVSKTIEGGSLPDEEFVFELAKEDDSLWEGAAYYLYDMTSATRRLIPVSDGNEEEEENEGELTDDSETGKKPEYIHRTGIAAKSEQPGCFKLKAGQAALFIGIKPETGYKVKEIASSGYDQITPASAQGYARTVDNTVQPAPFVNKPAVVRPGEMSLSVTKQVESVGGERPVTPDSCFNFILLKETASGVYSPVENANYSVTIMGEANSASTGTGDNAGVFTLGANQTARFSLKEAGTYMVKEFDLTQEYTVSGGPLNTVSGNQLIPDEDATLDSIQGGGDDNRQYAQAQKGVLAADKALAFIFTNRYTPKRWNLELEKVNQDGKAIQDVKFILYRDEDMTDPVVDGGSDQNGVRTTVLTGSGEQEKAGFTVSGLQIGRIYWLKEIETRPGFRLLEYPVQIKVYRDGDETKADLIVNGVTQNESNSGGKYKAVVSQTGAVDSADTVTVTVRNEQLYALPSSGGIGIYWYLIGGVLLMMAAALILYKDKTKYAGRC